jgi:hypothetical protein
MISQVEAKSNPSGEIPLPPPPQTTSLSQLQNTATHNTHTINSISLNSLSTTRSEENILNHNQNGAVSNNLLKERVQNKSEDKEMSKDLESMITTKNEQPLESVSRGIRHLIIHIFNLITITITIIITTTITFSSCQRHPALSCCYFLTFGLFSLIGFCFV